MLFEIITVVFMLLAWKTTHSYTITSILSVIWRYSIPPFGYWIGSWVSWGVMWELSSLDFISTTSERCSRKSGGRMELWPTRLQYKDWLIHNGCMGRVDGYSHPIYGNLVLIAFPLVVMTFISITMAAMKCVPYLTRFYPYLHNFFTALAETLSFLVELFVVTKPVEFSQGVLVDTVTYEQLVRENEQMKKTVLDHLAKSNNLEHIADFCAIHHTNPDATIMKIQENQLATSQQQLGRLRREYANLQNYSQILEDTNNDGKLADVRALRTTIDSKQSEILALRDAITALEARPDAENLKAEQQRAQELQQKLDAHLQEATASHVVAGLEREELGKLRASNKSFLSENKATAVRAQLVASSHKKAMDEVKEKVEELEVAVGSLQSELGQKGDEADAAKAADAISAANATIERLQQELEATTAQHREQFGQEVIAMKTQLQGQYEEQVRAAQKGLAEAAEAEISACVKERVAHEIPVARKELTEAAEAELSARILAARKELAEAAEAEINARTNVTRAQLAAAAEAEIVSRVDVRLQSCVDEALALRDAAVATMDDIPFGDDDLEFTNEFNAVVAECQQREDARQAEASAAAAAANAASSSNVDTEMSTDNPVAAKPINRRGPIFFTMQATPPAPAALEASSSSFTPSPSVPAAAFPISLSPAPVVFAAGPSSSESSEPPTRKKARHIQMSLAPAPAPAAAIPVSSVVAPAVAADAGVVAAPAAVAVEPSAVESANSSGRKRATGRRIPKIPGIGSEYHPQHVVAHAEAQAAAAAMAAFEAGKFFDDELPDVNKPFQGERKRVDALRVGDVDDGDENEKLKRVHKLEDE